MIVGAVMCTFIPLGYLADETISGKTFDTWYLRLIATIYLFGMFFTPRYTDKTEPFFVFYLFFGLYVVVTAWTAMFVFNAASVDPQGPVPDYLFWILQYMVALFMSAQLCSSWQAASAIFFGSMGTVYVGLLAFENPNWAVINKVVTYPAPFYLLFAILCALFNTNRAGIRGESLLAVRSIGSNIAHELRSPLTGMASRSSGTSAHLKTLINGYRTAVSNRLVDATLPERETRELHATISEIESDAKRASTLIDMVLMQIADTPATAQSNATILGSELADHVIESFPYTDQRQKLKTFTTINSDFVIQGNETVLQHIFLALLDNAFVQVDKIPDGFIEIVIDGVEEEIRVVDNGPGVPERHKDTIFEPFFSLTPSRVSSGNGLHFCRGALTQIGGTINYEREGDLTTFAVAFSSKRANTGPEMP